MLKQNYYKVKEWVHTLTMVDGETLTHLAKLEYEAGIDVEHVADGVSLQCEDDKCSIVCNFRAYGKNHYDIIEISPAGDRFNVGGKWHAFNNEGRFAFLRRMIVQAMRSVPKMALYKFRSEYLAEQAALNGKRMQGGPETFADIYKLQL